MESKLGTGLKVAKISVLVIFALSLVTAMAWAQTGTVTGRVVNDDGEPFAGVLVSLQNADGSSVGKSTTSDVNGNFRMPGVVPGTYTVTTTADGFQPASQPIEVTADGEVAVDFEMSPLFHDKLIVSAQRVEENILNVPMTISAFDTETMEELQIQTSIDLQDMTPGLQIGDQTQQNGQGTVIRGIGTQYGATSHADLGVATYVDGAYTLGTYGVAPGGGFDMKRVEVARGPQGTLHGRNSVAGSINLVTVKPEDRWDSTIMLEVTDVSQQRFNAAIGGPIAGPLSFRFTGGIHTGDGKQENIGLADDLDAPDQTFWAPQLRITTKSFDMNMRWSHVEDSGLSRSMVHLTNYDTTTPGYWWGDAYYPNSFFGYDIPNPAIDPDCPVGEPGHQCGDVRNAIATNTPATNESESDFATMYASYQISDKVNVRYSGSYSDVASVSWADGDYTSRVGSADDHTVSADGGVSPYEDYAYRLPFVYEEMSHELQFSGYSGAFNWIAGAFYYENDRSWTIDAFDYTQPWRFGTADELARANSPLFGFWPAEGCADTLAMIDAMGWGTSDPSQADAWEGVYYYCPEGNEHTQYLQWFTRSKTDTKAVFASGNYQINPNWGLSGGLRYTEDTKEQLKSDVSGFYLFEFGSLVGMTFVQGEGYDAPATWSKPIGHIAVEYTTDSGQLVYGRISTGYRAGGFNLTDVPGAVPQFIAEETLVNYEIGTKGAFFGSRLQLAGTAWFYDFQDYQYAAVMEQPEGVEVPVSIWSDTPLIEYTTNIPDTKVWGLDLEFSWWLSNHWSLRGFYAYQDSEIGQHESVVIGDPDAEYGEHTYFDFELNDYLTVPYVLPKDLTGNSLPMQPKNKTALTLGWNTQIGQAGSSLQIFGTYNYTDTRYIDIGNLDRFELPAYDRFDASISWTAPNSKYSVALFGKNLTNEIAVLEFVPEHGVGASALGYLSHGREIGLQFYWRPFR